LVKAFQTPSTAAVQPRLTLNSLPSSQFKTQYAKLTEPTTVTVNGHPIGTWTPRSFRDAAIHELAEELVIGPTVLEVAHGAGLPSPVLPEWHPIATEPNTLKESPQDIAQRARRERQKRIDAVLRASNKK
jgi:hypothetical protein